MRSAPQFSGDQRFAGLGPSHQRQSAVHPQFPPTPHPERPGEVFEGAVLFRQLRHLVQLPAEHVAYRLQTTVEVLQALENGSTAALPAWPETMRIVTAYTGFANIDPRPILSSIHTAMTLRHQSAVQVVALKEPEPRIAPNIRRRGEPVAAGAKGWAPADLLAVTRQALRDGAARLWPTDAVASLKQRRVVAALSVTLPLALLMSLTSGGPVQAVASVLPRPVTGFFKTVEDYVRTSMAPRREGFVWIDVADPRSRKTDKLPSPKR